MDVLHLGAVLQNLPTLLSPVKCDFEQKVAGLVRDRNRAEH